MPWEPISPELALVDPDLRVRALAALADPVPVARATHSTPAPMPAPATPQRDHRSYPAWARVTAALWLLVLGILIGGAAIPHAQEKPRVVPPNEDANRCKDETAPARPRGPEVPPGQ
jgi:hypothetical protein